MRIVILTILLVPYVADARIVLKADPAKVAASAQLASNTAVHSAVAVSASHAHADAKAEFIPYPTASPEDSKAHAESVEDHQRAFGFPAQKAEDAAPARPVTPAPKTATATDHASYDSGYAYSGRVFWQLVFAIGYWLLVVKNYPVLPPGHKPSQEAIALQSTNEVVATLETSLANCFLSWCCTGPRAAHTFHSTRIMNYWAGCCLMSLCPMCTLWFANSCTDMNERLGGRRRNLLMGLFCACCCTCCVVAQDAESLDLTTGMDTHCCSATLRR